MLYADPRQGRLPKEVLSPLLRAKSDQNSVQSLLAPRAASLVKPLPSRVSNHGEEPGIIASDSG